MNTQKDAGKMKEERNLLLQLSDPSFSFKYIFAEKKNGYLTVFVPLLRGTPCNTKFLREFNLANCRFLVFCGNYFLRMGETGFSCWGLIFAIFRKSPSIWISNVVFF